MANYGIDLGTTNTSVSVARRGFDGRIKVENIKIRQFDSNKSPTMSDIIPSAVYVDDKKRVYVGELSKYMRDVKYNNVISNHKRFIGKEDKFDVGGLELDSKGLAKEVLLACKKSMDINGYKKGDTVTITVPASFDSDQIRDTIDAAKLAGFKEVNAIPEPTAALIDFMNENIGIISEDCIVDFSKKKRILVLDLGGGTYDIALIDVTKDGKKVDFIEKAIGRYDELGGIDFDIKIQKYFLKKFCNERKIKFEELDKLQKDKMLSKLRVFAEKAKENISANISFGFDDEPYSQFIIDFYNGEDVEFEVDRESYDEITKSLYEHGKEILSYKDIAENKNIIDPIIKTLREYKIDQDSIDFIFLTGGMSQYATVEEKLIDVLGLKKENIIKSAYPLLAVSRGAAVYQHYDTTRVEVKQAKSEDSTVNNNEGNDVDLDINPVMGKAIMIDLVEGLPVVLIDKEQKLPFKGIIGNALKTTSPSGIELNLYTGDDEFDWQMKLQKKHKAIFKRAIKIGSPIDIKFNIDRNKYLSMAISVGGEIIELNTEIKNNKVNY